MKPTYEQLKAELALTRSELDQMRSKFEETQALLKRALDRIALLDERLNKNSKNSSKPPSSDQKPNCSGGGSGRRTRKEGINRPPFSPEQVDRFMTTTLECCPCCGSDDLHDLNAPLVQQQVEIPEAKATITEFSRTKYRCASCGRGSFAHLPNGIPNSAFGPRLMALTAMLTGGLHLSKREAMSLVGDLYGVDISEGSIINIEERVSNALDEPHERIHSHVMKSLFPKHFDETSWRDQGKSHYVWVGSTSEASCFYIDQSRSRKAFETFMKTLSGAPVVTDRYPVYNHLKMPHQYCLAHLIRDFRKYFERDGPDGEIGNKIEKELRQVCRTHRHFRSGEVSKRSRNTRFRHQKRRLQDYLLDGFVEGSDELSGLCDRLLDCFSRLWVFSEFTNVDPTNNLAERDLRRLVLWRKKSYGTRSERGKRYVERIGSVAQTVRKAQQNLFRYLHASIDAHYRGCPAPLISPALGF